MTLHRILPIVLLVAACSRGDRRTPPPAPAAPPALAHATQSDLRTELDEAIHRGTWREVRTRWQGQHLTWTVTRYRALCGAADLCNVAAFPVERPAKQGWMPAVEFAPGQFDAMAAACGDRAQCEVTIEGRLVELDATGERATKLRFDGVKLVGTKLAVR